MSLGVFEIEAPGEQHCNAAWLGAHHAATRLAVEGVDGDQYILPSELVPQIKRVDTGWDQSAAFMAKLMANRHENRPFIPNPAELLQARGAVMADMGEVLGPILENHHSPRTLAMLAAALEGPLGRKFVEPKYPVSDLLEAMYRLEKGTAYRQVQVPKRNGKMREIDIPFDGLKGVQRRIHDKVTSWAGLSDVAIGFRHDLSAVNGLKAMLDHFGEVPIGKIWTIDVKGFFPSITAKMLKQPVRELVNALMGEGRGTGPQLPDADTEAIADLIVYLSTVPDKEVEGRRHMVQGAPTSPALSNLVMRDVDSRIWNLTEQVRAGLQQTYGPDVRLWVGRYADDLALFMSDHRIPRQYRDRIKELITETGLELNDDKERWINFNTNKKRNRVAYPVWGLNVKPGRDGEPNTFAAPGRVIKKLGHLLHKAVHDEALRDELLACSNLAEFATHPVVGEIFGNIGYVAFAYRNGGEYDEDFPKVPKVLDERFLDFISTYRHILRWKKLDRKARDVEYGGKEDNPFVRRWHLAPRYQRLKRFVEADAVEENDAGAAPEAEAELAVVEAV